MLENKASRTAQRVATHRAAHQLLDHPKVFDDPHALAILGPEASAAIQADPKKTETSPISPFLRAFTVARHRFAEDELARAVERGITQYVILGAGLDTFAYRNPFPTGALHVFEVDFPATQAWKRERLKQAGIPTPEDLTFAPLDFHQQTLAQGLAAAGHDSGRATFFAWLGVTPYLSPEAVAQTLTQVVSCPKGSGLVFDYATSPELLDPRGRMVFDILSGWSRDAGEPWLSTFKPNDLGAKLEYLGFDQIDDLGQPEINARYFTGRADGLGVGALYHLVSAWV